MGRLAYMLVCSALLAGSVGQARSQGVAAQFPVLWQSYLTVCGQAISDPAGLEPRLTTLSPLPQKTFAKSTTGHSIMMEQMDGRDFTTAYLQRITVSAGHWIECEVGREFGAFGDGAQVAGEVHAMLSASGLMSAVMGEMRVLPASNMAISELHDVPWFVIVVEGVFPGHDITTLVEIDPSGIGIRMAGHVR